MVDPLGPSILSVLCLLFAAFIYALNAALPCVDESDLRRQAEDSPQARRVLRLLTRFDKGYGEIRLTYVLLLTCAFAFLWSFVGPLMADAVPLPGLLSAVIALAVFAIVSFTLTAIIPGGIAAHAPKAALRTVAAPAEWAVLALSPVTLAAYWLGKAILRPFHIQPGMAAEHISEEEIRMMVDIGEEKGAIEADEKEMIENIFEFNNMNAEDCMIHRKDITAIDADSTEEEVMTTIAESGLSRFPVYEDSIDNVIGILTSRDFLINRCSDAPKPFRELIRPAHFVPESVRTDVLFREMQTRKQHMSIVIDEYGGTSGLITLEDLLEEIVGNIYDEFDPKEEQDITPLSDGRWRVSGSADLEVLSEALDIELPLDDEYDTLGGLVFSHLTEIPADGEHPVVECSGLRISVTEIADRRVEWAIVEKLPEAAPDEEDESNPR
ncbi:MAG: hemolysin family protein [Candidatus Faecivicinus sp.]